MRGFLGTFRLFYLLPYWVDSYLVSLNTPKLITSDATNYSLMNGTW